MYDFGLLCCDVMKAIYLSSSVRNEAFTELYGGGVPNTQGREETEIQPKYTNIQ